MWRKNNNKKQLSINWLCGAICLALVGGMLTGCSSAPASKTDDSTAQGSSVSDTNLEVTTTGDTEPNNSDVATAEDIVISTDYGDLCYPAQWKEFLVTDQAESEGTITVSFAAKINEESYSLFTVAIGGEGDSPAGTLTASDGTQRNVYVQINEIQEDDSLDESEQNRLYAMQEDINYLLDSLE